MKPTYSVIPKPVELQNPLSASATVDEAASLRSGLTNKKVSNQRLKLNLGYQFKYPNFRKGYAAEIQRLDKPVG